MSDRAAVRIAWSVWGLHVIGAVTAVVLTAASPDGTTQVPVNALALVMPLTWSTTGAVVAARRPRHPIGWLLLIVAVAIGTEDFAGTYAVWAQETGVPSALPAYVAVFADAFWIPSVVCSATLVPLLFPDGHLPSRRWRPVATTAVVAAIVSVPLTLVAPGPLYYLPQTPNPLGVAGLGGISEVLQAVTTTVAFMCCLAALAGTVLRYRRAHGRLRMQLRWFMAALAALALSVPPAAALNDTLIGSVLFELFWTLPPIAIGIAVLRYRLYEIDRLISRTVTYAVVSAVLVAVYALVAVLPSALLELTSDLLVAAATLTAAAMFVPVRRVVQDSVDRHFNRARYDAQAVADRFGNGLRAHLDVDRLAHDLGRAVGATVQPTHVSLWLRGDATSADDLSSP